MGSLKQQDPEFQGCLKVSARLPPGTEVGDRVLKKGSRVWAPGGSGEHCGTGGPWFPHPPPPMSFRGGQWASPPCLGLLLEVRGWAM